MQNRIDAELTPERTAQIIETLRGYATEMPFLTDLSREEIQSLPKIGERGIPFALDALTLAEQDDTFLPRSFDVTKLRKDVNLYQQLSPLIVAAEHFLELLKDTQFLAGSDAFSGGLEVYAAAQRNGKGEALTESLRNMSKRFDRKPKPKEELKEMEETPNK